MGSPRPAGPTRARPHARTAIGRPDIFGCNCLYSGCGQPPRWGGASAPTSSSAGRDWEDFESFKRDLEAYIRHWNHVRRQVKLKGLTPVEFREQDLRAAV